MFITIHGKILILCKVPVVEDSYNLGSSAISLLRHLNRGPPQRRSVLDSGGHLAKAQSLPVNAFLTGYLYLNQCEFVDNV